MPLFSAYAVARYYNALRSSMLPRGVLVARLGLVLLLCVEGRILRVGAVSRLHAKWRDAADGCAAQDGEELAVFYFLAVGLTSR